MCIPITPGSDRMVTSAAEWRYWQQARYNAFLMGRKFVPGDLWPLTLTFKLVRARHQTLLPSEFGANPFSRSGHIWFTNKQKVTHNAKNRTLRSSLRALKTSLRITYNILCTVHLNGHECIKYYLAIQIQQCCHHIIVDFKISLNVAVYNIQTSQGQHFFKIFRVRPQALLNTKSWQSNFQEFWSFL